MYIPIYALYLMLIIVTLGTAGVVARFYQKKLIKSKKQNRDKSDEKTQNHNKNSR